ncbi:MAG: amidohydrolase family protein, partial [Lachnospiraceae bacterium]|nr:amidohydrolase family protein [Lachnospiraceae bacterium]
DHAPHATAEKEKPFVQAPSGMIGLETALSLAVKNLVQPGHLTMMQMLACLTCNPADFSHHEAGRLEPGAPADLTIFDPEEEWIVPSEFASKSCNSPFIGDKLPGVVHYTIVGGEVVYRR